METKTPTPGSERDGADQPVVAALRSLEIPLDELHRARLSSAIEAGLDALSRADERGRWRASARRGLAAGGLALVAAAALVALRIERREPTRSTSVATPASPPARAAGVTAAPAPMLAPYLYSGPGADPDVLVPAARLTVPAGARVRAAIGTRIRLTMVGPGAVAARGGADAGSVELVLEAGQLLVDYEGRGGGALRVRTPGALTTVVGTLFSVEVQEGRTRVGVSRGHVRTEARGVTHDLPAGRAWTEGEPAATVLPVELAAALRAHDASPPPPVGEYGIVRVGDPGTGAPLGGVVMLDRKPLAAAPLVARVPAGSHVVDRANDDAVAVQVAEGKVVRLAAPPPSRLAPRGAAPHAAPVSPTEERARELDALYAAAEVKMRAGANQEARLALEALVAREAQGPRGEAALIDLARLAIADGDAAEAQRCLARLPDPPGDAALAEPVHHLRCRAALLLDAADATDCLTTFRRRFPRSPHDAEALALLAARAPTCDAARPLLVEYLRLHPRGAFAAQAETRLATCAAER